MRAIPRRELTRHTKSIRLNSANWNRKLLALSIIPFAACLQIILLTLFNTIMRKLLRIYRLVSLLV